MDGKPLPCVLVENKIDLVDEEILKDTTEISKFAQENKYDHYFRTSAKTGIGIDECMDYLIKNILERCEQISKEGNDPFKKDRKSIVLDSSKAKEENVGTGCC